MQLLHEWYPQENKTHKLFKLEFQILEKIKTDLGIMLQAKF